MGKQVLKYPLSFSAPTALELTGPVVHVGIKEHGDGTGMLFVWAEAGVHPKRPRVFEVYGTGHDIPSATSHIGSVIDQQTGLVWHVYEGKS